ncbi:2-oxo acid dehydrogenase subunit E2 (plasmid) [Rhodococcus sp. USK10]|uniref:2-oxo acid dehydrogenase subunit E2 n=1 Tax=Rhodococcus sp. USK10 TaxID=2789739 RepID=UPI001C5FB880|nr:2-oxo acid dehydrogenase subunit E2 [Rhodococcus sp. USK10]QYB00202.1 2-oxo acid dehydrogenase subunit E2 [Rhodococcus sp. USK10]
MPTTDTDIVVTVPELGDAIAEATIPRWLKAVGDPVGVDEPLLEVATDKVDTEIPAPATGILTAILEPEDAVVPIGAIIARLGATQPEPTTARESEAQPEPDSQLVVGDAAPPDAPPAPAVTETSVHAAPKAVGDRVEKLSPIRLTIARRMLESLQKSAQLTTVVEADLTAIAALRNAHKETFVRQTGVKLSFLPFVVAAAVESIGEHPVINSSLNADYTEVTYRGAVHLGMAVDSEKGLMVPVIRDVDRMSIAEISHAIADLAAAVRTGTIRPNDLAGGTFSITNTGSRGALFDTPIINQPQSAILGVGTVVERMMPERDQNGSLLITARSIAYLSLSYDHRIIDGADAARYLASVRMKLEKGFSGEDLAA